MKKISSLFLALAFSAGALAQNAAVVNGKAISSKTVDFLIKQQSQGGQAPAPTAEQRKQLIEKLVEFEALSQEALKQGVNTSEIETELSVVRMSLLAKSALRKFQENNPVTDAELRAEYDKEVKNMGGGGKEVLSRHILVESEAAAKAIIEQLGKGAKFEELAKQSKDPGSAAQGGSLGWAPPTAYVPPFAEALGKLKKGETTAAPVQSNFGWHVIRLEDSRDAQPPKFEEVAPQMREGLQQKKLEAYVKSVRAKAVVK